MKTSKLWLGGLMLATAVAGAAGYAYADAKPVEAAASTTAAPTTADPVTPERLAKAGANDASEAGNWLLNNKTYNSNRYSTLNEITPDNVSGLKLAFAVPLGGLEPDSFGVGALEGTVLAKDGFLYATDAWGTPYKIDATSGKAGKILWIGDTGIDKDPSLGNLLANRGPALYQNEVITNLINGHVMAFDDATGQVVWDVHEASNPGEGFTGPPLVVGDKIIVGQSNGDSATRGFIAALDAKTGKELWRFYTVPAPDQPGGDTWKDPNHTAYKTGGGASWAAGAYDPATNTLYYGTGNPVPMFDPEYRPGRNLYTNSTVALDADTGKLKWYFQYTPGDYHDYDEIGAQQLVDVKVNGETRKVLSHFGRNGIFYTIDRTDGEFIQGTPYVNKLNWTKGLDPKTGLPVEFDPSKDIQTYVTAAKGGEVNNMCPNIQGGINYWPSAVDPTTGIAYGAGIEGCSNVTPETKPPTVTPGVTFEGGAYANPNGTVGSVFAYDVATGKQLVKQNLPYPNYSGVSLSPGLLWAGELDGTFAAYDSKTLQPKWSINMGNSFLAPPTIFAINGKEYVAIMGGGTGLADFGYPELKNKPNANMLYVFSL
ncbi:MAG TPA: PQQ-binding-like beta-propeller repeat protein [Devosia sp.]|nr:PQQ-binding-like beta-propeller repeat protein [Devosia sp.]